MSVTFAKMHKALISAQLTFTNWNPPVEPNHNRGVLWNENTQTYILCEGKFPKKKEKRNNNEGKKRNHFGGRQLIIFQIDNFLFLW